MKKKESVKNLFGKLQKFYDKKSVLEIFVDGPDRAYYEDNGKIVDCKIKLSATEIKGIVTRVLASQGYKLSKEATNINVRLNDDTRLLAQFPPFSVGGPSLVIRKIPSSTFGWDELKIFGSLDGNIRKIIEKIIATDSSTLIAGNAGSGKTTIANLFVNSIPENRRIVAIEKDIQMRIRHKRALKLEIYRDDHFHDRHISALSNAPDFVPDWFVTSEINGPEASIVIDHMRNGLTCLVTSHATDTLDALGRLELNYLSGNPHMGLEEVKTGIASALGYVIFQERLASNGKRKIAEISRIDGVENGKYVITRLSGLNRETGEFILTDDGNKFLE